MLERFERILLWFIGIAIASGLLLSIASSLKICQSACAEAHLYRFYGFSFDALGTLFFALLGGLFIASLRFPQLLLPVGLIALGALGAETIFILIQYLEIEAWCPICLSIAATVGLITIAVGGVGALRHKQRKLRGEHTMLLNLFAKGFGSLSAFAIGFFVALSGVAIPEHSFADGTSENEDPHFGNRKSAIEIYVVSDWYCTACKKIEPTLEALLPKIMNQATVIFIDRMLHPESLNYLPYNLSFMLKEKEKYLQLRQVLTKLTDKTKAPSPQDIQKAVAPLGVSYKPLNFSDIESGMRYFQGISKTFQVNSTPTVVIANKKKVQAKKLVGAEEITEENIKSWITKLSG